MLEHPFNHLERGCEGELWHRPASGGDSMPRPVIEVNSLSPTANVNFVAQHDLFPLKVSIHFRLCWTWPCTLFDKLHQTRL
jgi:hypothetical protein